MGSDSRQPAARLGDIDTGHPPYPPTPVITGSTNVFTNSRPAARKGDMLAPHHPGVRLITEGSDSVFINGKPAARVTDGVNCGGKMIAGSSNVLIGNRPAAVRNPVTNAEFSEYTRESLKPGNIGLTPKQEVQLAADIAVKYRGREGAIATWHDYFMGNDSEPADRADPVKSEAIKRAEEERRSFDSQHAAAAHVSKEINPTSIAENTEYGGMIYKRADGTFGYTGPVKGTIDGVDPGGPSAVPAGATATAFWHTHGGPDPRYDNENFSNGYDPISKSYNGDIPYADAYGIDGYVVTPSGVFKHYSTTTKKVTTLQKF